MKGLHALCRAVRVPARVAPLAAAMALAAPGTWAKTPSASAPVAGSSIPETLSPRQLAAPPEDFLSGPLRAPDYSKAGAHSRSAMVPVYLSPAGRSGDSSWSGSVAVDSWENARAILVGPDSMNWEVAIETPATGRVTRSDAAGRSDMIWEASEVALNAAEFPAEVFAIQASVPGEWKFDVTARSRGARQGDQPDGYVIVGGESPWLLYSWFDSRDFVENGSVRLLAHAFDHGAEPDAIGPDRKPANPLAGALRKVEAVVYDPQDKAAKVTLFDDGRHGDGLIGDGVFGATVNFGQAGEYSAVVTASGVSPDGQEFVRSTAHAMTVAERSIALRGGVLSGVMDDWRLSVALPVAITGEARKVRVLAEVWGRDANGQEVPVCWLGRMAMPDERAELVSLALDARWLSLAGAAPGEFELRNVRLQDPEASYANLDRADSLSFTVDALPESAARAAAVTEVSEDMLAGALPSTERIPLAPSVKSWGEANAAAQARGGERAPGGAASGHNLFLSHGYCSGDVWYNPSGNGGRFVGGDFTGTASGSVGWLEDYGQNRSHDQFAQQILMATSNFKSFALIAHSQGGCASLHLATYYYSGLHWGREGGSRPIQSVGTPYQGTSLAGSLAAIGGVFGAGCGRNNDLTYDGAAAWLSGIPSWSRGYVTYHTTTFTDGFGWSYCHIATDLLLDDPDDGTTEHAYGQLSGAHNNGLKIGWCHTFGMGEPGQTSDAARNATMNSMARR